MFASGRTAPHRGRSLLFSGFDPPRHLLNIRPLFASPFSSKCNLLSVDAAFFRYCARSDYSMVLADRETTWPGARFVIVKGTP